MYFEALCAALRGLPEIEALVLGGSRAGEGYDRKSDYDLYVYCTEIPPAEARREILGRVCGHMELGNDFWELEDDCVLLNGIPIDILYRNLDSFALNRMTHPGEKRMASTLKARAKILPKDFGENLDEAFACMFANPERFLEVLDAMVGNLQELVEKETEADGKAI